jgi:hypothetical protein
VCLNDLNDIRTDKFNFLKIDSYFCKLLALILLKINYLSMKKSSLKKIYTLLFLFLLIKNYGQVAISYPTPAENVTASYGSSYLYIRLDFTQAVTTGADVTITLPSGFNYELSSLVQTGTNAGLTIAENGGSSISPMFKIAPLSIALGNWITFKIKRQANCSAISGTNFKDKISVSTSAGMVQDIDPSQNNYDLVYPAISFDQPAEQTNAVLGQTYTRTFTINNGGNGCTNNIYLSLNNSTSGISLISLVLNSSTLTPSSTSGTTNYYTISGALLTADQILCNGETLTFTETYRVNSCANVPTNYSSGWGPTALPTSSWCANSSGIGTVTIAIGNPVYGGHIQNISTTSVPYVDMCTPFVMQETYTNTGTGVAAAATMYDILLRVGANYPPGPLVGLPAGTFNFSNAKINGIPVTFNTIGNYLQIDLNNVFNYDIDGVGVGVEDIDNDGFFDDLQPGKTVSFDITTSLNNTFTCATNYFGTWGMPGDIKYRTMCDPTIITPQSIMAGFVCWYQRYATVADGYLPANIVPGAVFTARTNLSFYEIGNSFRTSNSRFVYELTLPAGVTIAAIPNLKWYYGQYPGGLSASLAAYTLVGNLLRITSPDTNFGYPLIDLVYNCPSGAGGNQTISIPFTILDINNIVSGCSLNSILGCGTLESATYCPQVCNLGPETTLAIVERDPMSFGWTNRTLTTRQLRSAITTYDLSKALYLDKINIQGNATQKSNATNLKLRIQLIKDIYNAIGLTANSIDVVIKRGGVPVGSGTVTTFTTANSTATNEIIDWDLTSVLPVGGLLTNDEIETTSRYTVSSTNFTQHDVQTGRFFYFYNTNTTTSAQEYCNYKVPEFYLVGTYYLNGNNQQIVYGCTNSALGGGTNYIARRFDSNGSKYTNEFRPAFYINSVEVTLPESYNLLSATYIIYDGSSAGIPLTPNTTITASGFTTYTYINPGTWPIFDITVTNTYGAIIPITVQASCGSTNNMNTIAKFNIKDYYYAYASTAINTYNDQLIRNQGITYSSPPKITLTNQTGTIQAVQPTESFTIRMGSTGTTTAPYNWIAIPNIAGLVITQVLDIATATIIAGTSYGGGIIYNVNASGVTPGSFKDYKISFTYTSCTTSSFTVLGGWNCSGYPANPTSNPCTVESVVLTYTPVNTEVQVSEIPQPFATALCASQERLFEISNSQAGNLKNSTFRLTMPVGYAPVGASFQVQYPRGTGVWQTIVPTIVGNIYTYNLALHSSYPAQGIPGTIYSTTSNDRFIRAKFLTNTDCDYVPGSKFEYSTAANAPCGTPAVGSNINTFSN